MGEPQGHSPSGTMSIYSFSRECPGQSCPTIVLEYAIPEGTQLSYHENPGQPYHEEYLYRTAFLPNNEGGRKLAARLKYAFMHGLTFHVGDSLTRLRSDCVIWASIPHKTTLDGGEHGFPDPNYLTNCNATLDALHVPQAGSCGVHDNALQSIVNERLSYVAPSTLSAIGAFQAALEPYHQAPSVTVPNQDPQDRCPSGTMTITQIDDSCPGQGCSSLEIIYSIPADDGQPGTTRVAYLPNNDAGRELLWRLMYAWKQGLIFKIGTSQTTGRPNSVVWATIPHKTSLNPREPFSFPDSPDPAYFTDCHARLDALYVPRVDMRLIV
jgi:Deltex C-terminal domain